MSKVKVGVEARTKGAVHARAEKRAASVRTLYPGRPMAEAVAARICMQCEDGS